MAMKQRFWMGIVVVVAASCAALGMVFFAWRSLPPPLLPTGPPALVPRRASSLPSGDDAPTGEPAAASLRRALLEAAAYLCRRGGETVAVVGERKVSAAEMAAFQRRLAVCLNAGADVPALLARLEGEAMPCRARQSAEAERLRLTGYYHPRVAGSFTPSAEYAWPLYRRPADLVSVDLAAFAAAGMEAKTLPPDGLPGRILHPLCRWCGPKTAAIPRLLTGRLVDGRLLPFPDRAAIDGEGVLSGRGLELLWLADPVDRFFLQIQGSGLVRLPDGREVSVAYAGSNGRPYRSIGSWLMTHDYLPPGGASMPAIRDFLTAHPDLRERVLAENPRYVFFRLKADAGALGSGGMRLVPGRSIAVDPAVYPLGALAWLETELPVFDAVGKLTGWRRISRLVVTQDTGGAIRGPGRADLFYGTGREAERAAGIMDRPARLSILMPRAVKANAAQAVGGVACRFLPVSSGKPISSRCAR
jgi:membrane-bound lytic murein transglycosylase A